ncbi:hypothetical protein HMPREF1022_02966 [Desulfovibrio sp. 6_1_46AFAA]|uniref:hypothetical protein n=1 Tax=Desulfovibrio sp. 6_1_46AFAA TaxID=665942 RepID=UPI0002236EA3|nr:hypothetical protein [Desulfovibrio sp. 6_1_46AFAA]EGW50023.1 hypothetical protein HMPREF1022_02966 [Desulfovibrio sp. 6_1_46AFAA]
MHLARSRLDYMTALYLRCAGYSKADVANGIYRHAPAPVDERGRNEKIDYGRQIVGHAFGTAGDIDIASFRPSPEQIQTFNREAQEMERERAGQNERERVQRERRALRLR